MHAFSVDNQRVRKRIGDIFVEKGLVTEVQLQEILAYGRKAGMRFGDAALAMGLIDTQKLAKVFGPNNRVDFFYMDPMYFPKITQGLLPRELMLRYGVLPLGFKTQYRFFRSSKSLNLGLLNPDNEEAIHEARQAAHARLGADGFQKVRVFLILSDQFIDVFGEVYKMDAISIRTSQLELDPLLEVAL